MPPNIPRHVAIIPDGNRRWARNHNLTVFTGHKKGVGIFENIAMHAADCGVNYLSVWGMSVDNYKKRSRREVTGLMKLFRDEFSRLARSPEIHRRQAKIRVIGQWPELFPRLVSRSITKAIEATAGYSRFHLTFLLAYNGTEEMLQAIQEIVDEQPPVKITAPLLKKHLATRDLPPVDLLIRTAGEPHLSAGFMMWDVANAELYFTDLFWPDFTSKEFDLAIDSYAQRRRRQGA